MKGFGVQKGKFLGGKIQAYGVFSVRNGSNVWRLVIAL